MNARAPTHARAHTEGQTPARATCPTAAPECHQCHRGAQAGKGLTGASQPSQAMPGSCCCEGHSLPTAGLPSPSSSQERKTGLEHPEIAGIASETLREQRGEQGKARGEAGALLGCANTDPVRVGLVVIIDIAIIVIAAITAVKPNQPREMEQRSEIPALHSSESSGTQTSPQSHKRSWDGA